MTDVFLSYAHDDSREVIKFEKHLEPVIRTLQLKVWQDKIIHGGEPWNMKIEERLGSAEVFVLILSASYLASRYVLDVELPRMHQAEKERHALLVPIVLKPCQWPDYFETKQCIPVDSKRQLLPVTKWKRDEGFHEAARQLKNSIDHWRRTAQFDSQKAPETKSVFDDRGVSTSGTVSMTADKNSRILAEKSSKKTQPQTAFKEISETRSPTLDGETRFNHLRGDPLIIRCREIYDIARQAETTIRELLKSVTYRQGLYRFKSRLKSPKSIWQKVHRNRFEGQRLRDQYQNWLLDPGGDQKDLRVKREQEVRELEKFGPENVLDAFACRYVTLFEEQRLAVVRTLFELLDGFKVPAAEHVPVTLVNCSIYYTTAALGSEDRAKEIIELLSNADFAPRVIQDRSVVKPPINRDGYSSAHFNFELPVIVDFPRGDHPQNPSQPFLERARFEVQVRDIFEEAWSEAEHFLFYRQKDEFRLPNETEAMAKKLVDVHRRSIDATRSYMSEVKQQLDRARGSKEPNLSVKSTTTRLDDKAEIESILRGRVSSTILDILGRAYLLLHEAEEAATVDEGSRKYAEAATVFELLRRELGDANELRMIAKGGRPIRYFINMELANSLIFSGKSDGSSVARGMYEELAKDYPNDPTLRLRYARAISLQDSLSREEVDQALNLMKDFPRLVKADALTGPSHWLTIAGSTLHGYIYYVSFGMYQKDNRRAEALGELEAAITVTRQAAAFWRGLPDWLQRDETYRVSVFKATSNLIYYLALLLAMGGGGSEGFNRQAISDQIRENESIVVERLQDSYKSLANRMCGWVAIGEHEKAVSLAREIYGTLERYAASRAGRPVDFHEIGNYMKGAEAVDFNHVVNVVISQGRKWT